MPVSVCKEVHEARPLNWLKWAEYSENYWKLSLSVHWCRIKSQRQLWVKQKRTALLLCQAKGDTQVSALKDYVFQPWRKFFFFGHAIQHVWFRDQGSNLHPLHLKHRVLTTRWPGKSPAWEEVMKVIYQWFKGEVSDMWAGPNLISVGLQSWWDSLVPLTLLLLS